MGLSNCALRTISDGAFTIHKSVQLVSNLGVTTVTKSGTDTVGNIEIKNQNQHNLTLMGWSLKRM